MINTHYHLSGGQILLREIPSGAGSQFSPPPVPPPPVPEGEYWKATFVTTGTQIWGDEKGQLTYDHEKDDKFILEYIGGSNEFSQIETLEYTYETSSVGVNSRETFTEPPTKKIFTDYSKGSAKVQENEIIQVTVKWNQFEEVFDLINEID
ncbi:hypothetical protein [Cytobacillus sp. IB215316]|uniref:hypothetical protein n=1 Tax=Cytobacillus sp. IB215316 TaxID=3097354 RepID=UPI002A0E1C6D|nr:hypothetical protein [Cytobacillus sp. IB215316]MDX8362985.1 hypothetical protein [Cytobacillus sp. IB215316]